MMVYGAVSCNFLGRWGELQLCSTSAWDQEEELEVCVQLQGYDLFGIVEAWGDGLCDGVL